jgi:hypothetical protein
LRVNLASVRPVEPLDPQEGIAVGISVNPRRDEARLASVGTILTVRSARWFARKHSDSAVEFTPIEVLNQDDHVTALTAATAIEDLLRDID